jgi:hypothetical protein
VPAQQPAAQDVESQTQPFVGSHLWPGAHCAAPLHWHCAAPASSVPHPLAPEPHAKHAFPLAPQSAALSAALHVPVLVSQQPLVQFVQAINGDCVPWVTSDASGSSTGSRTDCDPQPVAKRSPKKSPQRPGHGHAAVLDSIEASSTEPRGSTLVHGGHYVRSIARATGTPGIPGARPTCSVPGDIFAVAQVSLAPAVPRIVSSISGSALSVIHRADTTLQRAASTMAHVGSGSGDVASGAIGLTQARTEVQLGVRLANTESKMQKALLDIFA